MLSSDFKYISRIPQKKFKKKTISFGWAYERTLWYHNTGSIDLVSEEHLLIHIITSLLRAFVFPLV